MSADEWITLEEYATATQMSQSALYRKIRAGRLKKRVRDGVTQVLLDDPDRFRATYGARVWNGPSTGPMTVSPEGDDDPTEVTGTLALLRRDDDSGEILEYVPADKKQIAFLGRSFATLLFLYREILADKNRRLEAISSRSRDVDDRLETLSARVTDLEQKLADRDGEIAMLQRQLNEKDDFLNFQDRSLSEKDRHIEELSTSLDRRTEEMDRRFQLMQELEEAVIDLKTLNNALEQRVQLQSVEKDLEMTSAEDIPAGEWVVEGSAPPDAPAIAPDPEHTAGDIPEADETMELAPLAESATAEFDVQNLAETDITLADPDEFL